MEGDCKQGTDSISLKNGSQEIRSFWETENMSEVIGLIFKL